MSLSWASRQGTFDPNIPMPPTAQHPNWVLPSGSLSMLEHPTFNFLFASLCQLFSSVVFIFPKLAQDFQTVDQTKCQGFLSSSGWVLFCSMCIPVIKHLPYCSKIYSETVLQIPAYRSRRTAVCFCSDENQTQNVVGTRPIVFIQWAIPHPRSWFYFCAIMRYMAINPQKDICPSPM